MIEHAHPRLSVSRQCDLLGLSRSSLYYRSVCDTGEDNFLMRLIDEQYTRTPFFGVRRMVDRLRKRGFNIGPKRVRRLMREMGIEAIYPKPRTSKPAPNHRIYPYLLRDVKVECPDHVWSTDITYIRMTPGFAYLVAIMDWFSRYVLSWRLSITLESDFCVEALDQALMNGARPTIFNSDQGSQFTSDNFTGLLQNNGILISMDGRGRAFDNIFVERLWRTVKYEEVYLKDYRSVPEARESLNAYFQFYNTERPHQSLGYATPQAVYMSKN